MKTISRKLKATMLATSILAIIIALDLSPSMAKSIQIDKGYIAVAKTLKDNNIHSLSSYLKWLRKNIHYTSDGPIDHWAPPQETIARGIGDCEDFAFLNTTAMNLLGYQATTLAILNPSKDSHAISVFKRPESNFYYVFDNTKIKTTSAKTIEELATYIFANYKDCLYLAKMDFEEKQFSVCFKGAKYISDPGVTDRFILAIGTLRTAQK